MRPRDRFARDRTPGRELRRIEDEATGLPQGEVEIEEKMRIELFVL